jgi:CheY-like chemotaxis protein
LVMPEMDGFEATRRIRKLDTGNSILDTGNQHPASSHQHPASSHQHPASSHQHPASSHQHPASSHQHPVSSDQHPVTSIQHPVIIAVSANAFEQTRQKSAAAGCDGFLVKPVDIDELLEQLQISLKLEWLYEEESDERFFERVAHSSEQILPPPPADLAPLYELIRKGDITSVSPQADRIERLDQKYIPFAEKVRQLAKTFRVDELEAFINNYMEEE